MPRRARPIQVRVHEPGNRRIDGILRLSEAAGRAGPLGDVLASMCADVAAAATADIVSIYVREGDGARERLVMRGNVGFPPSAVGNVRLRLGEGITGFSAECMRPVSVAVAATHAAYHHVPGLGEEAFPAFVAVPVRVGPRVGGVLVLQRRAARAFASPEVALATALAAPFGYALERAQLRWTESRDGREGEWPARAARLSGQPVSGGLALGRAEMVPSLDGLGSAVGEEALAHPAAAVAAAFDGLAREVDRVCRRLDGALEAGAHRRVCALAPLLADRRLRGLAATEVADAGVVAGLAAVAREYARVPYRMGGADPWLAERTHEIEDVCLMVATQAAGHRMPSTGAVVVAEAVSAVLVVVAVARRAAALVVGGPVLDDGLGAAVARAAALPVVAEVDGLFVLPCQGDRMLVDGDAGVVRINPPATAVAQLRHARRA